MDAEAENGDGCCGLVASFAVDMTVVQAATEFDVDLDVDLDTDFVESGDVGMVTNNSPWLEQRLEAEQWCDVSTVETGILHREQNRAALLVVLNRKWVMVDMMVDGMM